MATFPAIKLPKKEQDTFKDLLMHYENKQYKKGLKAADIILKKFPDHGETQAMKGLILHFMDRKEEGYEYIKNGLKLDLKSPVCWHVYGLVHKSDGNLKEAIKCYLNALRQDKDNQNILKDLSWLQLQMRDLSGYLNTRGKILDSRPTARVSWVAFAVANYLNGAYDSAFNIIKKFNEGLISDRGDAYEESEFLLFQNRCLEKQGKYKEAIDHLMASETEIVDKNSLKIKIAELRTLQGNFDDALTAWQNLLQEQKENYRFHAGLQSAFLRLDPSTCQDMFSLKQLELPSTSLILNDEQKDSLLEFYTTRDFKGRCVGKIKLTLARENLFRSLLRSHLIKNINNSVPALFEDVISLIRKSDPFNPNRSVFIREPLDFAAHPVTILTLELVDEFIQNLNQTGTFEIDSTAGEERIEASPSAILWAKFLKCQLLDRSCRYVEALTIIDECIEHTPTALDMYMTKARILKHMGEIQLAAAVMDCCRELDLQDRYLNNKATKYLLRADRIDQAMSTIAMFTKHDGDPELIIFELQCSWYELESAFAFHRQNQYGMALKRYYAILKNFQDYYEDMFDFHGYCVRKTTLRIYVDLLTTQESQYTHKTYQRAYQGAIRLLLHLLDHPESIPSIVSSSTTATTSTSTSTTIESTVKTIDTVTKKDPPSSSVGKEKEKEKDKDREKSNDDDEPSKKVDDDPKGEKLLKKDFLAEAVVWSSYLENRLFLFEPETLALFAEVKWRKQDFNRMLQAITMANEKYPHHPDIATVIVNISIQAQSQPPVEFERIKESWASVLGENGLEGYITRYVDVANSINSFPHLVTAASNLWKVSRIHLEDPNKFKSLAESVLLDSRIFQTVGFSHKMLLTAYTLAKEFLSSERMEEFRTQAKTAFPRSDLFKSTEELTASTVFTALPPSLEHATADSSSSSEFHDVSNGISTESA